MGQAGGGPVQGDAAPAVLDPHHLDAPPVDALVGCRGAEHLDGGLLGREARRQMGRRIRSRRSTVGQLCRGINAAQVPIAEGVQRLRDFRHLDEVDAYPRCPPHLTLECPVQRIERRFFHG